MSKPSNTGRLADVFLRLHRELGEVSARARCEHDPQGEWARIRAVDSEVWPVIVATLRQCEHTGKLHRLIAPYIADAIEGGLAGKIPAGWPEPTGHRATLRNEHKPEDVASLYRMAGKMRLLRRDRTHTKTILSLFRITKDQLDNWSRDYLASILVDGTSATLATFGLTVQAPVDDLDRHIFPLLEKAAADYRERRNLG